MWYNFCSWEACQIYIYYAQLCMSISLAWCCCRLCCFYYVCLLKSKFLMIYLLLLALLFHVHLLGKGIKHMWFLGIVMLYVEMSVLGCKLFGNEIQFVLELWVMTQMNLESHIVRKHYVTTKLWNLINQRDVYVCMSLDTISHIWRRRHMFAFYIKEEIKCLQQC